MELEELMSKLKKLKLEDPHCDQLQGAGPRVEYQQSAGPRLVPEAGPRGWSQHEAWPAIDRQ